MVTLLGGESVNFAFAYARVSSREQQEEGFSIPAQLRRLHDYADDNNLVIAQEFVDIETAKTPGRKAFDPMVESVRHLRTRPIILVEKTDRLYRNFRDAVT